MRSSPAPVSMFCLGSGASVPSALAVELHEHEVPDLDVALLAAVQRAALGPVLGALVEVDLRDGPHGPVSPISQKLSSSPRRWMRSAGTPTASRQMSAASSSSRWTRDPEPVAVEPEHLGHQLPGQRDGVGLEVVAEAEVAQHLEEAEVAGRAPDELDVVVLAPDAHALLHRRGPRVRRRLLAQEVRHELVHPRVGEQRRGGWCGIRPAEGTTVCPRSAKKPVNARRSWLASMTAAQPTGGPAVRSYRCSPARRAARAHVRAWPRGPR